MNKYICIEKERAVQEINRNRQDGRTQYSENEGKRQP